MLQVDLRRRGGARRRRIVSAALKLFDADAGEADKFLRNSPSLMIWLKLLPFGWNCQVISILRLW